MSAPADALVAILAEHEDVTYDLGTPRQYTQHGGWNQSCGCGDHLCSHPGVCDCHRNHRAQVLAQYVAGQQALAWDEGYRIAREDSASNEGLLTDAGLLSGKHNPYRQEADR